MRTDEATQAVSMAVSVPKRLFKRAVDRNLLKRRIREAYRLNKYELYDFLKPGETQVHLLIQYTQKEIKDYREIEAGVLKGFEKVKQALVKQASSADDGSSSQTN